mmetsp:Transcript_8265/g.21195  ORF Transcript_8265/g.21195 Transcript_8265/m.21195 type:complete len:298 (+) Transcript_8265:131-1024(+)
MADPLTRAYTAGDAGSGSPFQWYDKLLARRQASVAERERHSARSGALRPPPANSPVLGGAPRNSTGRHHSSSRSRSPLRAYRRQPALGDISSDSDDSLEAPSAPGVAGNAVKRSRALRQGLSRRLEDARRARQALPPSPAEPPTPAYTPVLPHASVRDVLGAQLAETRRPVSPPKRSSASVLEVLGAQLEETRRSLSPPKRSSASVPDVLYSQVEETRRSASRLDAELSRLLGREAADDDGGSLAPAPNSIRDVLGRHLTDVRRSLSPKKTRWPAAAPSDNGSSGGSSTWCVRGELG